MNITSINAKTNEVVTNSKNNDSNDLSTYQKGQVIEGLITKVSDQISINFSGDEVTVPKSTVQDAKEGEIRKYEIMDVSTTSIVLKEVGSSTNDTNSIKATWTNVETDQNALTELQMKASKEKEKEDDEKEVKEKLDDIANRMTGKDLKELIAEGISLETYDLARLEKALERIKEQQTVKQDSIDAQIVDIKEVRKKADDTIRNSIIRGSSSKKIAEKLEDADLPVTEANIARIATALELGANTNQLSDQAKSYLIGGELPLTIENVYKAQYCGSSGAIGSSRGITETEWNAIKTQAATVLDESGYEVNDENLDKARWLLNNNLPLTKDSLQKLESLNQISEGIQEDVLLDKIITSVSSGVAAKSTSLEEGTLELANQVVDDISKISDAAILKVANEDVEITLHNLKEAQNSIEESSKVTNNQAEQNDTQAKIQTNLEESANLTETDIKAITAKRQLEEIRLKMTVEASQKLMGKGIKVETESLEKVVEGLKEIEDNYYKSQLQEAGSTADTSQIDLLRTTTERLNQLKEMPSYILGSTLANKNLETVQSLYSTGDNLKSKLDKANESYDTLMTSPRKDLGDTIDKAFHNIDQILDDLGLENTDANQRAVKILGYNQMEITTDSIANIKAYDNQVNTLMKNLQPSVAVHLIKEGINPLDTPIEELNNQIAELKDDLGVTEEEKYSKYLWKLEKEDGLSEDERKGYIGIYRLLNNIEKTNGAAIGSVVGADQEVTLNNLLTAVRTMKSKGINQVVDDNFGALESISFSKETITEQLGAAFKEESTDSSSLDQADNHMEKQLSNMTNNQSSNETNNQTESTIATQIEYMNLLLGSIMEEITPNKVDQVANKEDILNLSLEKLNESLKKADDNEELEVEYNERELSKLQDLANNSDAAIKLLSDYQITPTISNLLSANDYLNSQTSIYKKINEKLNAADDSDTYQVKEDIEGFIDAIEDKDTMAAQYEKLDESVTKILNKEYENNTITSKDIADLRALTNGIQFVKELSKKECYEIPVSLNGEVTNINLTVVEGEKETGKISIKTQADTIGKVEVNLTVKGDEVKGLIVSNNRFGLDTMKQNKEALKEAISNLGLDITQLDYGIDGQVNNRYINNNITFANKMVKKEATIDEIIGENEIASTDETKGKKDIVETENGIDEKKSTNQLYQVAKVFVLHIKAIDNIVSNNK